MADVLALIPARGGSKGIPGKNLAPVAGKPLLAWTVEAALASRRVTRTVVSTDSDEIAAAAGADVLRRSPRLASDDTPMQAVVDHALSQLECDVLVLLQPTSPLRRAEHVDEAVALLLDAGADGVVSVVEVPHAFRPASLMRVDGARLVPLDPEEPLLRQRKTPLYARNGPAVVALRPGTRLYDGDWRAYVMDARDSLDVDTLFDLELADLLLSGRSGRSAT